MNGIRFSITIALITLVFVGVGLCAHPQAYIDLGTGSYMLQMVTAGIFGSMFAARSFLSRVVTSLRRSPDRKK